MLSTGLLRSTAFLLIPIASHGTHGMHGTHGTAAAHATRRLQRPDVCVGIALGMAAEEDLVSKFSAIKQKPKTLKPTMLYPKP